MKKQIIRTNKAPEPIGPYNQAIKAGNTVYLSGQIALDPETGKMVIDNVEKECLQVMENVKAVLNEAGMTMDNVVKCSIFLKDMDDFPLVNKVYGSFFTEDEAPARETVQVARLPKDVNVEISVIAVEQE